MGWSRRLGTPQDDALWAASDKVANKYQQPFGVPVSVNQNYNARFGDLVFADTRNSDLSVRLPDIGSDGIGRVVTIVNTSSNDVKVFPGDRRLVDDAVLFTQSSGTRCVVYIQASLTKWEQIGG